MGDVEVDVEAISNCGVKITCWLFFLFCRAEGESCFLLAGGVRTLPNHSGQWFLVSHKMSEAQPVCLPFTLLLQNITFSVVFLFITTAYKASKALVIKSVKLWWIMTPRDEESTQPHSQLSIKPLTSPT